MLVFMRIKTLALHIFYFICLVVALFIPQFSLYFARKNSTNSHLIGWFMFFILYGLVIALYLWVLRPQKVFKRIDANGFVAIIVGYFVFLLIKATFISLDQIIYHQTTTANDAKIQAYLNYNNTSALMIVVMAVVFAPICEELLFRGIFMKFFGQNSFYLPIFISGLLFGLAHSNSNIISALLYSSIGWVLGFIYKKYNNLSVTWGLHFLNNAPAILLLFF